MSDSSAPALRERLGLVGTLFVFWLLLSGVYTPFLLVAGLGAALAVSALALRMEIADREGHPMHMTLGALTYWPWLAVEIAKSGWQVTRIILTPRMPVSPALVRFKPSQETTAGLVAHANSITLTPGTITIEAGFDQMLVHALTRAGAEGVTDSAMDRRVRRLEGGT
jgi:multicomponent Na+:H+ antiporter subunit E